jgi:hypothetical protein
MLRRLKIPGSREPETSSPISGDWVIRFGLRPGKAKSAKNQKFFNARIGGMPKKMVVFTPNKVHFSAILHRSQYQNSGL